MSKWHIITLHHINIVSNKMFDLMGSVMRAQCRQETPCKADVYFTMMLARHKLSIYYVAVTPTRCMLVIVAHIIDPFRTLRLYRIWDKGMDIIFEDKTSYTMKYQEVFLNYVENKYCSKRTPLSIIKPESILSDNLFSSAMASRSGQSCYHRYDSSSDEEEYSMPNRVAGMAPRQSHHAAHLSMAARLHLNPPLEYPQNWEQFNPNLNDYHSGPMENSRTSSIPVITDLLWQPEHMRVKYVDLSNVTDDIFSIIPHGVRVESSTSLVRDIFGCRESKTTAETLWKKVIVRQFGRANDRILAGEDPAVVMTYIANELERKRGVED